MFWLHCWVSMFEVSVNLATSHPRTWAWPLSSHQHQRIELTKASITTPRCLAESLLISHIECHKLAWPSLVRSRPWKLVESLYSGGDKRDTLVEVLQSCELYFGGPILGLNKKYSHDQLLVSDAVIFLSQASSILASCRGSPPLFIFLSAEVF